MRKTKMIIISTNSDTIKPIYFGNAENSNSSSKLKVVTLAPTKITNTSYNYTY